MSNVTNISDSEFQSKVIESNKPVLVEFWAEWCGPCKLMSPVMDAVSSRFEGKVSIMKMNVDDNQITPPEYGIRGIPSIILIKDGKVVDQKIGAMGIEDLSTFISDLI